MTKVEELRAALYHFAVVPGVDDNHSEAVRDIIRKCAAVCAEVAQERQWITLGRKPEFVDGWSGLPSDRGFISCKNAERAILSALPSVEPPKEGK